MRRIFVRFASALAIVGLVASPAFAGKSPTEINAEIDANFADNKQGLITEAILRTTMKDIAAAQASLYYLVSTCAANQWVNGFAVTGAPTCTRPSFSNLSGSISAGQMIAPGVGTLGGVYSSSAGSNQFATGIDTTGAVAYAQPSFSNLSGTIGAAQLIAPGASTFGAVKSSSSPANQFANGINTSGVVTYAQPAFSNLSGSIAASQLIAPGASTLGGVKSSSAPSNQFATGIDTSGVVTYAQPTFNNLASVSTQLFGAANTWTAQQKFDSGTYQSTANYGAGSTNSSFLSVQGSLASPITTQDAVAIIEKFSNVTATTGVNPGLYVAGVKETTGANTRLSSIFSECQDTVGGAGSWCEGVKSIASLTAGTGGSAYGAVLSAGTGAGISYTYLVGVEPTVENNSGVNASTWASFNINSYAAGVSISCGTNNPSGNKCDVGAVINPYNGAPFRTGFAVYGNDGAGHIGVDDTAFATKGALVFGADFSLSSFSGAAILLPNLGVVRAKNAAGGSNYNIMYLDASDQLTLGTDAVAIINAKPVVDLSYHRATAFISNGSAPTITGSGACTLGTQVGGSTSGKFTATAACATGQTYTISGMPAAINGYVCDAGDRTTSGVVFQQTSDSTTSAVLTVRTTGVSNADVIQFKCMGY